MLPSTLTLALLMGMPFLCMLVAVLVQARLLARWRAASEVLEVGAGHFVADATERLGLWVDVGLQPGELGGGDGYWSSPPVIALSQTTWADRTAVGWAIGAHELGHALAARSFPGWDAWGPRLRQLADWSARIFLAFALVAWLCPWSLGWTLAGVAAAAAAASASAVAWDEAQASRLGLAELLHDHRFHGEATARRALLAGWGVYLAGALGRWGVVLVWPYTWEWFAVEPAARGFGLAHLVALGLTPFLLLRVAQVSAKLSTPVRPRSTFRMLSEADEEARWSFLAGVSVVAWVVAMAPQIDGVAGAWAATLALVPAAGSVAALGQLPVVLPLAIVMRWSRKTTRDDERLDEWCREDRAATAPVLEALLAGATEPRWTDLLNLSFVPFLALALARMLSG